MSNNLPVFNTSQKLQNHKGRANRKSWLTVLLAGLFCSVRSHSVDRQAFYNDLKGINDVDCFRDGILDSYCEENKTEHFLETVTRYRSEKSQNNRYFNSDSCISSDIPLVLNKTVIRPVFREVIQNAFFRTYHLDRLLDNIAANIKKCTNQPYGKLFEIRQNLYDSYMKKDSETFLSQLKSFMDVVIDLKGSCSVSHQKGWWEYKDGDWNIYGAYNLENAIPLLKAVDYFVGVKLLKECGALYLCGERGSFFENGYAHIEELMTLFKKGLLKTNESSIVISIQVDPNRVES